MASVAEVRAAPKVVAPRTARPTLAMATSRSNRVRRSVTSRALMTMAATSSSSRRLVATPSSHTHAPVRRWTRKVISAEDPGVWRAWLMPRRRGAMSSAWTCSPWSEPSSSWGSKPRTVVHDGLA